VLPRPRTDGVRPRHRSEGFWADFFRVFIDFFRKDRIVAIIAFLMLFRFAEAQLVKMAYPFLLDDPAKGGLGLDTSTVGFIKGTVAVIALLAGGILGGVAISRRGLRFWIWPMVFAINIPDLVYVYLAY